MNLLGRLSIQSKLVLVLIAVSLASILVATGLAYRVAREAATRTIANQLTSARITKTNLIKVMMENLRDQVTSFSTSRTALESIKEFSRSMDELRGVELPADQARRLESFYNETFLPGLAKKSGSAPQLNMVLPSGNAARHMQYHYIAANPHPYLQGQKLLAAEGDKSSYHQAHQRFHGVFGQIANRVRLEDVMLIRGDTLEIVYTYQKTVELGTSLSQGPYANTNLAASVRDMLKASDKGAFGLADFENYRPNLGSPAAFLCSPVFEGSQPAGVVVFQFPIDDIVRVMTANFNWKQEGLGDTGEVYVVGSDHFMRTRSRFMYQDPDAFLRVADAAGLPEKVTGALRRQRNVIMALPVSTAAVRDALEGKQGVVEVVDYRNEPVLSAYGPLDFDRVRWAVLAEMDIAEAYAPVAELRRQALLTAAGLSLVVSLLALAIGAYATRPISALTAAARRVTAGAVDVQVEIASKDEFRELGDAFNQMTASLKLKTEQLETTVRENEDLLLNILPAPVAQRLRDGDEQPRQTFADVSILYAEISGLEKANDSSGRALMLLQDLVVAFDEAAEAHGIEKMKTIGSAYLAACGLSVARPDHVAKTLEFAEEILRIVRQFNRQHGLDLEVDVGVNAGPVLGGVIGRKKFIYDLWGDTVSIARSIVGDSETSIHVTPAVYERVKDLHAFERREPVPVRGGEPLTVWRWKGARADGNAV